MELFIRLKNGAPFEHPILGDNFTQAFPDIDVNNLPDGFAKFVRVECPLVGPYEINEGVSYEFVDGVVMDVWKIRAMTPQEKQEKIQFVLTKKPFDSWSFDEPNCRFIPPVPYPQDGKRYEWDESTISWKESI